MNLSHIWRPLLIVPLFGAGLALWVIPTSSARAVETENVAHADQLDAALMEAAPKIIAHLHRGDVGVVGVLKFLVRHGDGRPTDNAGELNGSLADRLEIALILANPDERLGIIRGATDTAAKNFQIADLNDPTRRRVLFAPLYELAWGDSTPVQPDRFLTGVATIGPDLKSMRVTVRSIAREGDPEDLVSFDVEITPRILADAGHSYLLTPRNAPELFGEGARGLKRTKQNTTVAEVTPKPMVEEDKPVEFKTPPVEDAPVKLYVKYNDRDVPINNGSVPEPAESTKVTFELENVSDQPQAVVLKVNGMNTLFRERAPDLECHKWVLDPGQRVPIPGFQEDLKGTNPFRVLAPEESRHNEINFGPHAGTFRMAVFPGTRSTQKPEAKSEFAKEELALAAIARGPAAWPASKDGSLRALQSKLRRARTDLSGGRGLIVADDRRVDKEVKQVYFRPDLDIPTYLLSVRYYQSKR